MIFTFCVGEAHVLAAGRARSQPVDRVYGGLVLGSLSLQLFETSLMWVVAHGLPTHGADDGFGHGSSIS